MKYQDKLDLLAQINETLLRVKQDVDDHFLDHPDLDDEDNYDSFVLHIIQRIIKEFQDRG